jgi:peptidoglycan/LPS O-acetylase OafA/YrhL
LDGVRGIAILAVVACHATAGSLAVTHAWWGHIGFELKDGLALFFVLSGYLLYGQFLSARRSEGRGLATATYAWRRALRIVPAYWVALTVLAIWPGLTGVFTGHWWVYYGFGQVYGSHTSAGGLPVAWSLCVEVVFYACLPVYAALLARLTRRLTPARAAQLELAALTGIFIASLGFRELVRSGVLAPQWLNTLPSLAGWLTVGMGLAVIRSAVKHGEMHVRVVPVLAGHAAVCWTLAAAVLVLNASLNSQIAPGFRQHPLALGLDFSAGAAVAFLVILPAIFPREGARGPALLRSRALVTTGVISYGIFLWHFPLAGKLIAVLPAGAPWFARAIILFAMDFAAAAAIAMVSWRLVERPLMKLKRPRSRRLEPALSQAGSSG